MLGKQDAVVVSAYTGVLCCEFSDLHEYIEKVMGRPVFTHEMGSESFMNDLRDACRDDFMEILSRQKESPDASD